VESPLPRIAAINTSFPTGNLFHPGSAYLGVKVFFSNQVSGAELFLTNPLSETANRSSVRSMEEIQMKNSLLSSVAALALAFGAGQALAQGAKSGEAPAQKSDSAAPKSESASPSKAESTAPSPKAESSSPAGAPKASTAETQPPSKSGATAQDKGEMKGSKSADDMKSDSKQPSSAQTNSPANNAAKDSKAAGTDSKSGATTGNAATSATAAPPAEKRTQIVSTIRQQKVEEVTNVNFNVAVGTTIPASVRFHPLPPRIVEIYPEWRGYEFILVHGKYIIVRPQTREIVYIIES
jgi:hypothetical protein